jgi:hypothetical protein
MGTLLMVLATFCLALCTLALFGVIGLTHATAWGFLGLTLWALAVLIGGAGPIIERIRQ